MSGGVKVIGGYLLIRAQLRTSAEIVFHITCMSSPPVSGQPQAPPALRQALAVIADQVGAVKNYSCMMQFFPARWHIKNKRLKALPDIF